MLDSDKLQTRWPVAVSMRGLLTLLLLAVALGGCVSAKERFERARNFEQDGNYQDAVQAYVQVLQDEPDFPNARANLMDAAERAMRGLLEEARADAASGRYERAMGPLNRVRGLQRSCEGVDVQVPLPDGYTAFRDDTERRAADALTEEAETAIAAENWERAFDAYDRMRRYVDDTRRLQAIDERKAEVLFRWADAEMERGVYRSAYLRADNIYDLVPASHPLADDAEALQQAAVARGTERVAFLPLWRTESAGRALSDVFLPDLNDVLVARYWASPPRFIAPADPIAVRRTMRRYEADRTVLSRRNAAEVGRAVDAALVVVGEITEFTATETDVDEERVRVGYVRRSRGRTSSRQNESSAPSDTFYVHRTYDLELDATVEYRVVEARTRRVVDRGSVHADAEGEMEAARFPGDWRNLDLAGAEKDLFDPILQERRRREIETRLLDRLADEYANASFEGVLDEID